ncbi:MAG: hypothetical protein ACLSAP_03195 [Oscillospiraceae bacterium]
MRYTIYVTEDEENIRELIRCTLESFGYGVECFETAEEMLTGWCGAAVAVSARRDAAWDRRNRRADVCALTSRPGTSR